MSIYLLNRIGVAVGAATLLSSCAVLDVLPFSAEPEPVWIKNLEREVSELGAENWILVTDHAYPIPQSAEAHVVLADAKLDVALAAVFEAVESEGHIWPRLYTLREFDFLEKDYAPGVASLRELRTAVIAERKLQVIPQSTVDLLLEEVIPNKRILIVKSTSAYPYSSVFMELDSGYWNARSEDALRKKMDQ